MNSLLARLEQDLGLTTSSLSPVRIEHSVRAKAGDLLVPPKDMKVSRNFPSSLCGAY